MSHTLARTPRSTAAFLWLVLASQTSAAQPLCQAESAANLTPVLELYTSEGCSSCPPADQWLSTLKDAAAQGRVVGQAFHVAYWDYIGWADRFANPAFTVRQRQLAARNGLTGIYTPQLVRNGADWRDYGKALTGTGAEPSRASIKIQGKGADSFSANVVPTDPNAAWSAYWSVTEHGHSTKVRAGENAGESLKHDFVVRQYVPAGDYSGAKSLKFNAVTATPGHARQINLVVYDSKSGKTLQALSLACQG
jgi:hypothetical protein